jgi:hypothetical protein
VEKLRFVPRIWGCRDFQNRETPTQVNDEHSAVAGWKIKDSEDQMTFLKKSTLSAAALLAGVSLSVSPAMATDAAVDLANSICASGDVAGSLASSASSPDTQAVALGEAARQLAAGQCKATQAAIDAALQALLGANPGNPRLQMAYNDQKASGGKGKGDGIKGFSYDEDEQVKETLVTTAAGEAGSPE